MVNECVLSCQEAIYLCIKDIVSTFIDCLYPVKDNMIHFRIFFSYFTSNMSPSSFPGGGKGAEECQGQQ